MSNGIYMGADKIYGEKATDVANIIKEKERAEQKYTSELGKRKGWNKFTDFLNKITGKKFQFVKDAIDQLTQNRTNLFRTRERNRLKGADTFLSAGLGAQYAKEFDIAEGLEDVDFEDRIMAGILEKIGATEGTDILSNLFKKKKGTDAGTDASSYLDKGVGYLEDYFKFWEEGGQVPKYYGGGQVQGKNAMPTISEYFNKQGKSLGGSNKQSLAEMLGRK